MWINSISFWLGHVWIVGFHSHPNKSVLEVIPVGCFSLFYLQMLCALLCSGETNRPLRINRMHKHLQMATLLKNAGWKAASHCIRCLFGSLLDCSVFFLFTFYSSPSAVVSVRSSVCRMSSREKMSVQDQSKERGVSGGLELNEDRESSPGKAQFASSPQPLQASAAVQMYHEGPEVLLHSYIKKAQIYCSIIQFQSLS